MRSIDLNKLSSVTNAKEVYAQIMQPNGCVDEKVRKLFNTWQKRSKGYQFTAQATTAPIGNIDLSGTAKMFLGFRFANAQAGDTFTLNINEELIIEDGNAFLYNTATNQFGEYFEYLRFLTGKDTIKVTYKGAAAQNVELEFYYI